MGNSIEVSFESGIVQWTGLKDRFLQMINYFVRAKVSSSNAMMYGTV